MSAEHMRYFAVVLLLGLACGPTPKPPQSADAPPPADPVTGRTDGGGTPSPASDVPKSYLALFEDLVSKIETHHVFSERERALWPAKKARLRAEFERVQTRGDALVALAHLQASLGDRHCWLSPPTDLRSTWLELGVTVFAEAVRGHTVVRVDDILDPSLSSEPGKGLAEGDEIVAVDEQPVESWLAAHPYESSSQNEVVQRAERALAIVVARLPWSPVKPGDTRALHVRRGSTEWDVRLTFQHPSRWAGRGEVSFDDAPPMKAVGCRADKHALYTNFELAAVGTNVCVYKPVGDRGTVRKDTRLVRFVSFLYDLGGSSDALRAAKADHALLTRELTGARAVVLDVHENHGGNNPFVFLSWFAGKAWDHQNVHVRVSKDFTEDDMRQFLYGEGTLVDRYRAAAKEGRSEESWPFLCQKDKKMVTNGTCEAQGPRPSERVTNAPIAIVTGPECTSSCDSLVADWSTFSMGPVVGLQPGHGFTTVRHAYPLVGPDGRDLGRFRIALSWEAYPRSGKPLEGTPVRLDWEAPLSFETRRTWVDLSVQEAVRRAEAARK